LLETWSVDFPQLLPIDWAAADLIESAHAGSLTQEAKTAFLEDLVASGGFATQQTFTTQNYHISLKFVKE